MYIIYVKHIIDSIIIEIYCYSIYYIYIND